MPPVAEETTEIGAATESKDTTEIKETVTEIVTESFREVDGAFDETDGDLITGGTICIIADTVACNDCHSRGLHCGSPSTAWLMWDSSKSPSFSFLTVGNNFQEEKKKKPTPSTSTAMKDRQELASAHHTRYLCDLSAVTGLSKGNPHSPNWMNNVADFV